MLKLFGLTAQKIPSHMNPLHTVTVLCMASQALTDNVADLDYKDAKYLYEDPNLPFIMFTKVGFLKKEIAASATSVAVADASDNTSDGDDDDEDDEDYVEENATKVTFKSTAPVVEDVKNQIIFEMNDLSVEQLMDLMKLAKQFKSCPDEQNNKRIKHF